MRLFFIIGFNLITFFSFSQSILLPYVKGDKYAIVNQDGKEILPAVYDDLIVYNDYKLMALLKGQLWGIYTLDGRMILDHTIGIGNGYNKGPTITKTMVRLDENGTTRMYPNGLLTITDHYANVNYYVNPNLLLSEYKPYDVKIKRDYNEPSNLKGQSNIQKVMCRNARYNYIDSSGREIFNEPISNGYALSNNLVTVSKDKKYALINNTATLTEFIYDRVYNSFGTDIITCKRKEMGPNGYEIPVYDLYKKDGSVLATSVQKYDINYNHVVINKVNGFDLYDRQGNHLLAKEKGAASFIKLGAQLHLSIQHGYKYGLINLRGDYLLDTIYSFIKVEDGLLSTRGDQFAAVLDTNLQEIIRMDSVQYLFKDHQSDYFKVGYKESWYTLHGLVDKQKKLIVKPEWRDIKVSDCSNLVYLKGDSTVHVRKLNSDNDILKRSTDYGVNINCKDKRIVCYKDNMSNYFTLDGTPEGGFNPSLVNRAKSTFLVKKSGNKYELTNQEGITVLDKTYNKITVITDPNTGSSIYICRFAEKEIPKKVVYDDQLKQFIPSGYTFPERWTYKMKTNPGTLLVVNKEATRYKFKTGMIDYNGNWLFKPINGLFQHIEKDLFIMTDYDKESIVFYNGDGKVISDGEYDIVDKGNGSDFFQDRILVGTIIDKDYKNKVKELYDRNLGYKENITALATLGKPKIEYRFLNMDGKKLNDKVYSMAKPYDMREEKTTVSTKRNGKTVSQVIDPNGNVLFEGSVDELDFLGTDYYMGKVEDKWGIIDTLGNIKTPFQFSSLYRSSKSNHFEGSDDNERFYISENYKIISLGTYDRVDIKTLNDQYFYIETSKKMDDTYKYEKSKIIYDVEGNVIVDLGEVSTISNAFNNVALPVQYVAVQQERDTKTIIYDLVNKKFLKE